MPVPDREMRRKIAVDLDDVLSQTNLAAALWHNEKYGTNLSLDDFYYANYWKNPHWGSVDEATAKIKDFFDERIMDIPPVPGALNSLRKLRSLGFDLIVVTARHIQVRDQTIEWLEKHYDQDLFQQVICTGEFYTDEAGQERFRKSSKIEVCRKEQVVLLIDDSIENALECAEAIPVILFGQYSWNRRVSKQDDPHHHLSHAQRLKMHGHSWWEKDAVGPLPENVVRVQNWIAARALVAKIFANPQDPNFGIPY